MVLINFRIILSSNLTLILSQSVVKKRSYPLSLKPPYPSFNRTITILIIKNSLALKVSMTVTLYFKRSYYPVALIKT